MEEAFEFLGGTQRGDKQYVTDEGGQECKGIGLKGTMKRSRRTYKSETTITRAEPR